MTGTKLFIIYVQSRTDEKSPFLFQGDNNGISNSPSCEIVADNPTQARDRFLAANPDAMKAVSEGNTRVAAVECETPAFPS